MTIADFGLRNADWKKINEIATLVLLPIRNPKSAFRNQKGAECLRDYILPMCKVTNRILVGLF